MTQVSINPNTRNVVGDDRALFLKQLEEQDPNIIYGRAGNAITAGKPIIVQTDGELAQVDNNSQTTSYTYFAMVYI